MGPSRLENTVRVTTNMQQLPLRRKMRALSGRSPHATKRLPAQPTKTAVASHIRSGNCSAQEEKQSTESLHR